ncbi:MAG: cysteine--tRNA ligase [Gammaproteobacteria bacterium]|nr:cysteine--tRNA ligase [Gammaproteobacteria bacterium]
MHLYNTLTRRKEKFTPGEPGRVTVYVCGPTVYSYAHIGNARPAVVFDVLVRLLRHEYDNVVYARNITDIDDKINKAAEESGVPISEITDRFTRAYHADLEALGVLPPDIEPRVTDTIPQIISMIRTLVDKGAAYEAEGHVLFSVAAFDRYGELSHRDRREMVAGARVEVAPYKKDPADFVLWKPSTGSLPGWESPWGYGRPGWHIECSSMIETYLGRTIDIHGGGSDLIFPHHENENAQSTCAHDGDLFARFWVHNGFVNVDSEKMSKSLGNVLLVRDLLETGPGEAVRLALISAHYRAPLDWTDDALEQARRRLDGLYRTLRDLENVPAAAARFDALMVPFLQELENDLNTPKALAELSSLASAANAARDDAERGRLKAAMVAAGRMLGLLQQEPEEWFAGDTSELDSATIEKLVAERSAARSERDFARADALRDRLYDMGIEIEDGPGGTRWRKLS